MDHFKNSLDYATAMAATTQQESSSTADTRVMRNLSLQRTAWKTETNWNDKDIRHIQIAAFYFIFLITRISKTFQFFPVFWFIVRLCLWPYIYITTHFPDQPVLSFPTIRSSTTHHSVQRITMQLVYAISYLMLHISLERRYLRIWEDVSCDGKLLQRLLQFIFLVINVKCVLL